MKQLLSSSPKIIIFVIVALFLPSLLLAQPIWVGHSLDNTVSLEIFKPDFEDINGSDNTTFLTSAIFLSLRLPIAERILFVADLPFVHAGLDFRTRANVSESMIGNPYLGLEFRRRDFPVFTEIGVRVPLAPDKFFPSRVGIFSDFDRLEAFLPDVVSISGMVNFKPELIRHLFLRLRTGPSLLINTDDANDSELYLVYSAVLTYEGERFGLRGGFTGRLIFTEEGDIGERTFLEFGLTASLTLGNVRPGGHFRLPLEDDLSEVLDFVFGINLGIQIK
ncbi:MAG: hypothetical protein ACE5NG_04115 [bacterium]